MASITNNETTRIVNVTLKLDPMPYTWCENGADRWKVRATPASLSDYILKCVNEAFDNKPPKNVKGLVHDIWQQIHRNMPLDDLPHTLIAEVNPDDWAEISPPLMVRRVLDFKTGELGEPECL